MVWLKCSRGREWSYQGTKTDYTCCPTCHSKISIHRARRRFLDAKKEKREERRIERRRRLRRRR